jgi:biopolymer transport protein ExbB
MTRRALSHRCLASSLGALLLTLACPGLAMAQPLPSLEQAFRRERALLSAEKKTLAAQLGKERRAAAKTRRRLEGEVRALLARVAAARKRASDLDERAKGAARKQERVSEQGEVLEGTLAAAAAKLRRYGAKLPAAARDLSQPAAKRLPALIQGGAELAARFGRVHREQGWFYAADGKRVSGTIVRVGRVAALGVSGDGVAGGVLRKAPGGGLRVSDRGGLAAARGLLADKPPELLPVYLFDPEAKLREAPEHKTFWEVTRAGGTIAWIILAVGLLGVLLVLERIITLLRLSNWRSRFVPGIHERLAEGDEAGAREIASGMGAAREVLLPLIDNRLERRAALEERAAEAVLRLMPRIERSLTLLGVIVTVAPLLGLLGTVTGMISTFDVITQHGTGDPKLLSHGISEALITTEFGLAVAVPLLLLRSFVSRWADRLVEGLQTQALALVNGICGRREQRARERREARDECLAGGGASNELESRDGRSRQRRGKDAA